MYFESIYYDLEKNQARIPSGTNLKLVTRHSLRFDIEDPVKHHHVALTPEGICLAQSFGRKIQAPLGTVYSSPIHRCIHTAQCILDGYAQTHPQTTIPEIIPDERLYEPYISDRAIINEIMQHKTDMELLHDLCDRVPVPGCVSLDISISRMLDVIFAEDNETNKKQGCIDICVTHDFHLVLLTAGLLSLLPESTDNPWKLWPYMFEGMLLWGTRHDFHIAWRTTVAHCQL